MSLNSIQFMEATAINTKVQRPIWSKLNKATLNEACRSLLILLFVYAGTSKALDYQTFQVQLNQSPFIGDYSTSAAWLLIGGELFIALLLFIKKTTTIGYYLSLFLLSLFTAYIYYMLKYSLNIPCSCGGIISKLTWPQHLWFNIGFIAINIAGILTNIRYNTAKP